MSHCHSYSHKTLVNVKLPEVRLLVLVAYKVFLHKLTKNFS